MSIECVYVRSRWLKIVWNANWIHFCINGISIIGQRIQTYEDVRPYNQNSTGIQPCHVLWTDSAIARPSVSLWIFALQGLSIVQGWTTAHCVSVGAENVGTVTWSQMVSGVFGSLQYNIQFTIFFVLCRTQVFFQCLLCPTLLLSVTFIK